MFYDTEKNDHNLPYNPYKSIVVPRPIGWISSLDQYGNSNLAPYSQFNNLGYDPPYVMFSASNKSVDGQVKDSVANIVKTGEFVCNMATYKLRNAVARSANARCKRALQMQVKYDCAQRKCALQMRIKSDCE